MVFACTKMDDMRLLLNCQIVGVFYISIEVAELLGQRSTILEAGSWFSECIQKFDRNSLVIYNVKNFAKPQEAKYNLDPHLNFFSKNNFFDKERVNGCAPNL